MSTPLPMDSAPASAQATWERFQRRRAGLTARMQLSVCDGCDGCGERCTAGFGVTRQEWEDARAYLARQPAAEVWRVLEQDKHAPWPGDGEGQVVLCRFRDRERGNCFLYEARPTICRLFGHTFWLPCPIGAVSDVPEGADLLWNSYRRFERRTWEEWEEEDSRHGVANQEARSVEE